VIKVFGIFQSYGSRVNIKRSDRLLEMLQKLVFHGAIVANKGHSAEKLDKSEGTV
jgi:hypothetical protein